ncbi:MAG: cell division protein FtsL [Candidatus Zixiibacteriota bacterium]|nr:MAG: cell division protein FtsL [candidate division Zixibacteria bacterium]
MKETIRKFKETVEINSSGLNRIRSHRYFPVTLLLCVFLVAACVHVWQRVQVVELVKEVSRLNKESAELMDARKKVYSEIATLSTASRIEQFAIDSLGLRRVSADRLFTLVPRDADHGQLDDLQLMLYAINRVAEYVPTVSINSARAGGVENLELDSLASDGDDR